MNAAAMLQKKARTLFRDFPYLRAYIDDVVVWFRSMSEHIIHFVAVCSRIRKWEMKVKLSSCEFAKDLLAVQGYIIGKSDLEADLKQASFYSNAWLPET